MFSLNNFQSSSSNVMSPSSWQQKTLFLFLTPVVLTQHCSYRRQLLSALWFQTLAIFVSVRTHSISSDCYLLYISCFVSPHTFLSCIKSVFSAWSSENPQWVTILQHQSDHRLMICQKLSLYQSEQQLFCVSPSCVEDRWDISGTPFCRMCSWV